MLRMPAVKVIVAALALISTRPSSGFVNPSVTPRTCPNTALSMSFFGGGEDDELLRESRSARSAGAGDRLVELKRPLGLVLEQDEEGNVYVATVAPRGNAARTGLVKEGDFVTMCSATFGGQMWSTRGVGLTRVLAAIRVRAGPTVSLVFETAGESKKKVVNTAKIAQANEEARFRAQKKKDKLLKELDADDQKLKKTNKFFGLF
mmetsp:Transcript_34265/g.39658  ORF Transcript_34265/g.39658 Transcript_34265/m.39658 type:complete len:205 (+) Transcript_34265:148-762(+)